MEVICEMMKLKDENIKDYIEMHNNTWPELVKEIRKSGFLEEYIYLLGTLVIVIMKTNDFRISSKRLSESAIFKKWTAAVKSMLTTDEDFFHTNELIIDLEPAWRLDNFDEKGNLTNFINK